MSDTTVNTAEEPATPEAEQPPAPPAESTTDSTDWKAEARKHEKRAKENAKAAAELEKLKAAAMSDQEKAVAEAKAAGAAETAKTFGARLATAEFKAAAAAKGVDVTDLADLVDASRFLSDDGNVDDAAITAAVDKLAKLAPPKGPSRSGGDFGGAPTGPAPNLDDQIAQAKKDGNTRLFIRLQNQKLAQQGG